METLEITTVKLEKMYKLLLNPEDNTLKYYAIKTPKGRGGETFIIREYFNALAKDTKEVYIN